MESYDESIKLLKKRMHRQMNDPSENDIKPENIQYYASSLMMQKENVRQKEEKQKEEQQKEQQQKERQREDAQQSIRADGDKENAVGRDRKVYKEPPAAEDIKKPGGIPPVMKDIKVPETADVQHERAKNEYEKVLQAVDDEEIYGFRRPHWLNIKG